MSLADLRRQYRVGSLERRDLREDPLVQFNDWFEEASRVRGGRLRRFAVGLYKAFQQLLGAKSLEPNAMVLATVDGEGRPSARTVLLKGIDSRGFTFFTNYRSRKGRELEGNPNAALVFYWPELERQVCVIGSVSRLPTAESEAYFRSRPRGSQIGAWASRQSAVLADRRTLVEAVKDLEARYAGQSVPLPKFWGGYVLAPSRIEFWQGREDRLHDRFQFQRTATGDWECQRLSP